MVTAEGFPGGIAGVWAVATAEAPTPDRALRQQSIKRLSVEQKPKANLCRGTFVPLMLGTPKLAAWLTHEERMKKSGFGEDGSGSQGVT